MLVGVREFRPEEVQRICGLPDDRLTSHYSLVVSERQATVADATDVRARKVFGFDHYASSARDLFSSAVAPAMRALLAPSAVPQVAVVVDGTEETRRHSLLDPDEGLLAQCLFLLRTDPEFLRLIDCVYMAVVELDENNNLRDITPDASMKQEPTIMEDPDEYFTSLEDTSYVELRTDEDLQTLLDYVGRVYSPERHQVFSYILSYKADSGIPNSTMQFLSLAVSEHSTGMRSTRHCLTTAASLLESRSPSTTFSGSKLSHLLKPALLGKQPGLWIACFAPATPSEVWRRETFKEAFCIAYTSSRIYSSRVGVSVCNVLQRFVEPRRGPLSPCENDEVGEIQPRKEVIHSTKSSPHKRNTKKCIYSSSSPATSHRLNNVTTTPNNGALGLVKTPSARRVVTAERHQSTEKSRSVLSRHTCPSFDSCRSLDRHQYNCSARYELETYKRVMEPAMEKLRHDIQAYAAQLDATRRELRAARRGDRSVKGEVERLRALLDDEAQEKQELMNRHKNEVAALKDELRELREHQLSRPLFSTSEVDSSWQKQKDPSDLREGDSQHAQRSAQWLSVIDYHQRELDAGALRERSYRERIASLESALTDRDAALAASTAALAERDHRDRASDSERRFAARLERLRAEVAAAKESAARAEARVEAAAAALRLERGQRRAAEAALRRVSAGEEDGEEAAGATREAARERRERNERQFRELEREVEAARRRSSPATPRRGGSSRRSQMGKVSPAVDTPASDGKPSTRLQRMAMGSDGESFEEYMMAESGNTQLP